MLKATLTMADGSRIALRPGVVSVGRSAESTIPLNDTNVSRRHAELRLRGEGADAVWVLVDLGSTNGTLINGVKVNGEQVLRKNDAIVFGATKARYEVA
jgi:pSer/pThr/pTyr-binding forkhead associated (FHA) protein